MKYFVSSGLFLLLGYALYVNAATHPHEPTKPGPPTHPRQATESGQLTEPLPSANLVKPMLPSVVKKLSVANVWSGHPVGFELKHYNGRQYVGYYDANRHMTIAVRDGDSDVWEYQSLPSKVGWDSHNYVTFALDREGHLHVVGNLHVTPLIYYRTTTAGDISTLAPVDKMVGNRETEMTYPRFFNDANGRLVFSYRDGRSGSGSEVFNVYNETSRSWTRLLDTPLFDGQGVMNAYARGPVLGPDNRWHVTWVWRDTPDAATNHDLSYARSSDLINWETVAGEPLTLPLRLDTPGLIVDPVPIHGGILNGSTHIGYDLQNRVTITYHKFDKEGATQVYIARAEAGEWKIYQLTQWTHRWDIEGRGTIPVEVNATALAKDDALGLFITLDNKVHGKSAWVLAPETLRPEYQLNDAALPGSLPPELFQPQRAGMQVRTKAVRLNGQIHLLRWETLPSNRDKAHTGEAPAPYPMELLVLE